MLTHKNEVWRDIILESWTAFSKKKYVFIVKTVKSLSIYNIHIIYQMWNCCQNFFLIFFRSLKESLSFRFSGDANVVCRFFFITLRPRIVATTVSLCTLITSSSNFTRTLRRFRISGRQNLSSPMCMAIVSTWYFF